MRTYGEVRKTPDGWEITKIEPHVAIRLKHVFQRIPKTATVPFFLTGGPDTDADLHWFLKRYPMRIDAVDEKALELGKVMFERGQRELTSIMAPEWKPVDNCGFRDGERPYDFQAQAAEVARRLGRLLVGDDVGLGKTVTALAAISDKQYLPAAIVVQAHLASQWKEKIEEFTTLRAHVIKGTKPYEMQVADVYIFKYSNIAGWVDYVKSNPFKSVVYDEIQELRRGSASDKGHAAKTFSSGAALRLGLSATPIYNYGSEIFEVCEYLEHHSLGSWAEFSTEWCRWTGRHSVVNDPKALGSYLREKRMMIRRTEEDVKKQMPPINPLVHKVPFDQEVAKASEDLARQLAIQVTTGSFVESGEAAREFNALLRHVTGMAKSRHVAAFVKILLENNQPLILAGWHRDVYDVWLRELEAYNPMLYTGSESASQKDRAKRAFIKGDTNLLIMSLRSGAGLDGLQDRSHTVVFGELDWSPQVHYQLIGRLRRPGQTKQVEAHYLVADDGSDPFIISTLGLKSSQSKGIVDPYKDIDAKQSDGARIKALAEAYLKKEGDRESNARHSKQNAGDLFGAGDRRREAIPGLVPGA